MLRILVQKAISLFAYIIKNSNVTNPRENTKMLRYQN